MKIGTENAISLVTNINNTTSKTMGLINNSKLLLACLVMLAMGLLIQMNGSDKQATAKNTQTEQLNADTTRNAEMAVER